MGRLGFGIGILMVTACGSRIGVDSSEDSSDGGGEASDTGLGSESGADDGPLTHGFVWLELQRSESQSADPFVGTEQISVRLTYGECLAAFYEAHPELRAEGFEGAAIFGRMGAGAEGWFDRLCSADPGTTEVPCRVKEIEQELDADVPALVVIYEVVGEVEGRRMRVGPLPTTQNAECTRELAVVGFGTVVGETDGSEDVWTTESFAPTTAIVNQAGPITIRAAAL